MQKLPESAFRYENTRRRRIFLLNSRRLLLTYTPQGYIMIIPYPGMKG